MTYSVTIICAILFYVHKFIPNFSNDYLKTLEQYEIARSKRTIALNKIKKLSKGTLAYKNYILEKTKTRIALNNFKKAKKEETVFGFSSLNLFLERFGLMLCIFVYTLYNLYTSFRNEPKNTGAKIVHSFIISVCFFYFYWIFQQFQDVSKITYYFMTFASAFIVTLAVYLITQYRKDTIAQLKRKLFLVSKSALLHTPIDKKEKLYQEFKDIAKE
ncbi:conserved membrane protein of unknown function [Tenacibaculum sp. 190524A02b]|uniref:Uncharacterized protein n=1 Tax=Tenacibaculum vairaonense TaxID=3137860 RepID=A0ABM9PI10_9FLAO